MNAAGGGAGEVAALAGLAGLAVPVAHSRRYIHAAAPGALAQPLPMTTDLGSGCTCAARDRGCCSAARPDQPDGYDASADWPRLESVLELASARFGWLASLPPDRPGCRAGTYENSPDGTASSAPTGRRRSGSTPAGSPGTG